MSKRSFRAVLHCYTGGRELAIKAIEMGLSISFTGMLASLANVDWNSTPPYAVAPALRDATRDNA